MYNNYISQDYLIHYGVKGMKWGVRHDPERVGSGRRAAKKQYKQDRRAALERMKKTGRKLTSEGRENDMKAVTAMTKRYDSDLRKAKSDYLVNKGSNKLSKNIQYRDKLLAKSEKKAEKHNSAASELRRQYNDMKKNGLGSKTWQDEVNSRIKDATYGKTDYFDKAFTAAGVNTQRYNKRMMEYHMVDVKQNAEYHERVANSWMHNNKQLMNMKIDAVTKKREIRKTYSQNKISRIPNFD